MFPRLKTINSGGKTYRYLQIVESRKINGKVRQKVLHNVGRIDNLSEEHINGMIESLARFTDTLIVLRKNGDDIKKHWDREWAPVLVFRRLWEEAGLDDIIARRLKGRNYQFDMEAAVFLLAYQRLMNPGSDLRGSKWLHDVYYERFQSLQLQHLYRAAEFLSREKEEIETRLFGVGRDLFSYELSLVFFDTTNLYFEGEGPLAAYGKSKDHRSDRTQVVVAVVIDKEGNPLFCETWPGNTTDATTVEQMARRMRTQFGITDVVLVCDRGMMSNDNAAELESNRMRYIIGERLRRRKEVRLRVLADTGEYAKVADNLEVKEVIVEGRRYVACHNPEQAERDRLTRAAILESLEEKLRGGQAKSLIANRGYRKYLKMDRGAVRVAPEKVEEDALYDGKFVLRTNTDLPADEVARQYKRLWQIERHFRSLKDIIEARPIYHRKAANVKGHIFGGFLSLFLKVRLQKKLDARGDKFPWDDMMADLRRVKATKIELKGRQFIVRDEFTGSAGVVFRAAGLQPPPLMQEI